MLFIILMSIIAFFSLLSVSSCKVENKLFDYIHSFVWIKIIRKVVNRINNITNI